MSNKGVRIADISTTLPDACASDYSADNPGEAKGASRLPSEGTPPDLQRGDAKDKFRSARFVEQQPTVLVAGEHPDIPVSCLA